MPLTNNSIITTSKPNKIHKLTCQAIHKVAGSSHKCRQISILAYTSSNTTSGLGDKVVGTLTWPTSDPLI